MSIPGRITQGIEDSLLGRDSEPTASDAAKGGAGEGLGAAAAERARKYREMRRRMNKSKNLSKDDGQAAPEPEYGE